MKVRDLLGVESIQLQGAPTGKEDAIRQMVDLMCKRGNIADPDAYLQGVFAREEEGTTGIGEGIAIPHCKSDAVSAPGLAAMVVPQGVEYDALDGEPVHIIFLIAAPNTEDNVHLEVLSRLSVLLMDEQFTKDLMQAKSPEDFLHVIDLAEADKEEKEEAKAEAEKAEVGEETFVVAVTGCPTGIAHTYMAAEALEKAAAAAGCRIKVETRGSGGAKNVLTDAEIASAKAVIVAADTKVPMDRFDGKALIECKVADGISKAAELVDRAMRGDAKAYHARTAKKESKVETGKTDSVGHQIYTHLMNGVSHMLPFVIGGGILTAIAFLIDTLMGYGAIGGGSFGSCTPVSAFFKYVGGLAMGLMVPVLAGYIAYSIADRPGLAVGFAGGVLAMNGTNFAGIAAGETTGISGGFLAALLAGFVAGYVVEFLKKITEKLPASLNGIRPMLIYPLGGILIVGAVMCGINPVMGMINTAVTNGLNAMGGTSKVLLGAIVAGMMSIDMGGPFNKAAYVFGTAALASGNYEVMAAVMVGGMVPPIAIALSTTFCPKKWTADERRNGIVNYVMGLCFVTEGAIPYAAADPLRVLPSCVIGAALSGALSMTFGCALRAPHGGIFVFPVVDHAVMYCVALAIGSVVGAVILSLLKKNRTEE